MVVLAKVSLYTAVYLKCAKVMHISISHDHTNLLCENRNIIVLVNGFDLCVHVLGLLWHSSFPNVHPSYTRKQKLCKRHVLARKKRCS